MVHSSGTAATLLGFTVLVGVGVVAGNRCYVCVPKSGPWRDDALSMFPGPPQLLLCENFHPRDKRYERECPAHHTGCLTQSRGQGPGQEVLRTCTERAGALNDCKEANDVLYCFCSGGDLCNGDMPPQDKHSRPGPQTSGDDDDDLDLQEGSGAGGFPTTTPGPTTPHPPHGTTTRSVTQPAGSLAARGTLGWAPLVLAVVIAVQ